MPELCIAIEEIRYLRVLEAIKESRGLKPNYNDKDGSRILMRDKHNQKLVRKANCHKTNQVLEVSDEKVQQVVIGMKDIEYTCDICAL